MMVKDYLSILNVFWVIVIKNLKGFQSSLFLFLLPVGRLLYCFNAPQILWKLTLVEYLYFYPTLHF